MIDHMTHKHKKPFQGYWNQKTQREAQLARLKNQLFRLILWIIACFIIISAMAPW